MEIIKYNEKTLLWLHRKNKSIVWLAKELQQTRQAVSQKIKQNGFTEADKLKIRQLGLAD
jgi:hypothetical protein